MKSVKPILANQSAAGDKIILVENQKILMTDNQIVKTLNDFFSNTIKTLGIPKSNQSDLISNKVNDPTLTLKCLVFTKGHTYLNTPVAESCRFA